MPDDPVPYDEWLAKAGLIEPEFVRIQDGYYTQTIVLDEPLIAHHMSLDELTDYGSAQISKWHTVQLPRPIPRYRTELQWKWAW